ncbi:MAG: hypothetical protein J5682_06590, partial [Prevotella sp.]|nr:hypothetical protein [Prevotella sp.]
MKRLLTSLFLLTTLMGSTWGASLLYFDYPTIDIPISADPVTNEDQPVEFHQPLRWLWDENDPNTLWTITDEQEVSDFTWSVHTTGDMKISGDNNGHTVLWQSSDGKDYQLSSGTFYYRGTSGSITLTAVNPDFLGVAYSASYTIYFRMGIEVKKWDFNSTQYTITGSGWDGAVSHMNTTQGSTSPEYHKCSKPDGYNGDGGSLVTEAAGLTFNIPANTNNGNQVYFGGNNPDGTVPAENRFICFYNGASFTIPASYFDGVANPRIRIKTDRYGGDAIGLEITNGKDALGTKIEDTYFIGGSQWRGDKGDNNFRGEYHFQLTDPTQPFTVKVVSGQWLMLLSVEVYNSEDIISENTVLGSNFQLLNRYDSDNAVAGTYYLHYYGRGERTTLTTHQTTNGDYYWPTGTVTCTNSSFTCTDGLNHTYTSTKGEVGNFNIRIEVRTRDDGQKYCTDY